MENVKVRLVKERDIIPLSKIYSKVFSGADPEKPWDIDHSYQHLLYWFKIQPDMFFCAFNQKNEPIGGIAVAIKPWRRGNRCSAGIIFVDDTFHLNGVGKILFRKMLRKAIEKYQTRSFEAITFAGKDFPANWYKKLGILPDEGALLVKGNCLEILAKLS